MQTLLSKMFNCLILLSVLGCYCVVLVVGYPLERKTVSIDDYEKYGELCSISELSELVPKLCQKVGADDGQCMTNILVKLQNENVVEEKFRTIAVCSKNKERIKCLSGADKNTEVLVWNYKEFFRGGMPPRMACTPIQVTDILRPYVTTNDAGCTNCFGWIGL